MAEERNKKSTPIKKKKVTKGSPVKRSFFFKTATIILALLTSLLLILGGLYMGRVQHWFSSAPDQPVTKIEERYFPLPAEVPVEKKVTIAPLPPEQEKILTQKTAPLPIEEYHDIPLVKSKHRLPPVPENGPLVAIIVDDLGADLLKMKGFLDLDLDLTAAIMPNVPHARAVAELAHADGREVILHMPMEPRGYPTFNPGQNALLVELSKTEIEERLHEYLKTVPWIVGANNHMGSRFTENSDGMKDVLQVLRDQGLFFIDSLTTVNSVAIIEAEKIKIAHAERDLFLDNVVSEEAIRQQIRQLIKLAKKQGSAIGICHPHHETYAALKKEAPTFAASGVTLVPVSQLVHESTN